MIRNGDILGGMYQIIGEIGQGGGGIIYLAEHLRLRKKIVVKKIKDNYTGPIDGRAEVDILKRLHHTYLPQVYDFLVLDSSVYTVMEYIEGRDLQKYLDEGYQFPETVLRKWLLQLSEVLEYIHKQKPAVLHSDIKPSNLMITPQQDICLIDFNISLDGEQSRDVKGVSAYYAAPEQYEKAQAVLRGEKDSISLDGRMDIYSLGATFFRVMTGILPSPEKEMITDIMQMDIPYSEGLKAIVSKAMRRRPGARFQTAGQMRRMLERVWGMDPWYKRIVHLQVAGICVWLLCILVGAWMIYYGSWQHTTEKWQADYSSLYLAIENGEEEKAISEATAMLQDSRYQRYLKKHEEEHAETLHILGESYFYKEMYADAADCYREAWELMPQDGSYCKDYIVALVRNGQVSAARGVMNSAEGLRGLTAGQQELIQTELAWMDGAVEDAILMAEEIMKEYYAIDADSYLDACRLQASIYETQGNYAQAVTVLEKARETMPSKEILRQLGQTAAAAAEGNGASRSLYLQKAYACYRALEESGQSSYADGMNLALIERAQGKYEASNNTLRDLRKLEPEDYRAEMWMCYNYLSLMGKGSDAAQYKRDFRTMFSRCKEAYRKAEGSDPDMERLIELSYGI